MQRNIKKSFNLPYKCLSLHKILDIYNAPILQSFSNFAFSYPKMLHLLHFVPNINVYEKCKLTFSLFLIQCTKI